MTAYTFEKCGPLLAKPEGMPGPGPYFTSLLALDEMPGSRYDYALYCSSDHDPGAGGIWLYLAKGAPTDPAHWVSYDQARAAGAFDHLPGAPAGNPIHIDSVQGGGHTETPHAALVAGRVYLSYHKDQIPPTQATLLATSADGVVFERIRGAADSVILRYDPATSHGDGHTGYFRWGPNPFAGIAAPWVGYSLHGGGDDYYSAQWTSTDGVHWTRRAVLKPIEGLATPHPDRMIIWHGLDPASVRPLDGGGYVALCDVGNRASGSAARIVELYEIYLAADGVTLTHPARRVLPVGEENALDSEEVATATSTRIGAETHLLYVGACKGGTVNTVMGAVGRFDPSFQPTDALDAETGRMHILPPETSAPSG